jgi:isopenicillin-N epimerase
MFEMGDSLRDLFLLDPTVHFLNHGSFGACPRPVFDEYQRWQRELERQPVAFFRRADGLLAEARAALGRYLNADPDSLLFVPNATTGLNIFIRSLRLQPGDEILTTNHEYGALNRTWEFVCGKTGARYVQHPIPLPAASRAAIVESFWAAVTPRTRVIFLSHITSPTALILPIEEICRRARAAGIMTVIDGAHAPGQVPIDLAALDADCYSGNCHKWLCAPKGSAFLWVRPAHQSMMEPLVVSHGWRPEASFQERHSWQGTRDLSAFLTVPAAIEFQRRHDWEAVRRRCHALASEARQRLAGLFGLPPLTPDSPEWFGQMITLPLPPCDLAELKRRLYDEHRVEAPTIGWQGLHGIRLSFQGYNSRDDLDAAVAALADVLPH